MNFLLALEAEKIFLTLSFFPFQMSKMTRQMGSFKNHQRVSLIKAHKMTKMIMVIVGIFTFCNTFQILNYIIKNQLVESFANLFIGVNSSVNGIIYGIFNKKFREAFLSCSANIRSISTTSDVTFEKTRKNLKIAANKMELGSVSESKTTFNSPRVLKKF